MLRTVALACLLALAASSELSRGSRPGWLRSRRQRRSPPLAFQLTETIFSLPPEEVADGKPYLLMFRGRGDDYCAQMEPLIQQLEGELGLRVRTFEVWYDTKNVELLQKFDRGRCGGVPFFYNKQSRRFICGATTYANLKTWALGEICEPFLPPPNLNQQQQQGEMQGKIGEFVQRIKDKAQAKMAQQKAILDARRGGSGSQSQPAR